MQINYFIILISVREGAVTSKAPQSIQNFVIQMCETGEWRFQIQGDEKEFQFENTWKVSHLYPYTVFYGFSLFKHKELWALEQYLKGF